MSDILSYETVDLDEEVNALKIIDQTKLPKVTEILTLKKPEDIWEAIYMLRVRGAPAIGVAAAIGMYVFARDLCETTDDIDLFVKKYSETGAYLNSARPTAVNLSWALNRMEKKLMDSLTPLKDRDPKDAIQALVSILHDEALFIKSEDTEVCRKLGEYGLTLIKKDDGILTHCNAGQLATSKYGTATAPMYLGLKNDYSLKIYCDETRPLLQGARLTAYELSSAGMDVTLLCDNMA
ncbi:MAG: S-methyl-5-thioribose-1-phosphate isomerase, partial [Lachnospiraceae bacterium]|nr:S-methyl-5-thioribose-1-phosphate isomerase [Lachnospiraceae bacterium]